MTRRATLDVRAVVYAGVAAGTLATIAQIALWWVVGDALSQILLRDAHLRQELICCLLLHDPAMPWLHRAAKLFKSASQHGAGSVWIYRPLSV